MRPSRIALALAFGLAALTSASGCAPVDLDIPAFVGPNADELQPGKTTEAEAAALLERPASVSTMPFGKRLLQWQYYIARHGSRRYVHLAVVFDNKGVMESISHRAEIPL